MTRNPAQFQDQPCRTCATGRLRPFLDAGSVPVHVGAIWRSPVEAKACPVGPMVPGYCEGCGLVYNLAFDPRLVDYSGTYDNALHFSTVFQRYERELAESLIDRYQLRGRRIIEVGCGSGHFLRLMCELGQNEGLGYEPSHDPNRVDPLARKHVRFLKRHYGGSQESETADLVCLRHVLEHVADPAGLLRNLREAMLQTPGSVLYCEVPSANFVFGQRSIWDLIYEHCSYFFPLTLRLLAQRVGFEVLRCQEGFAGQFLSIEARPLPVVPPPHAPADSELAELKRSLGSFSEHFERTQNEWRERLSVLSRRGGTAVVWGAGAKTVQFACLVGDQAPIDYVVDINPGKQGSYLAGCGWPVRSPEALRAAAPALVVIPNPIYEREIRQALRELGVHCEIALV